MPRTNVVERVLKACRADPALVVGGPVVVAVSGGPDSTALLHALWRGRRRLNLDLSAAHFDHGWRRESASEAKKVAALCQSLDVPLVGRRARPGGARSEDAARRARYRFLESVALEVGAG